MYMDYFKMNFKEDEKIPKFLMEEQKVLLAMLNLTDDDASNTRSIRLKKALRNQVERILTAA